MLILLAGISWAAAAPDTLPEQTPPADPWVRAVEQRLKKVDTILVGDLGVYIEDLDTRASASLRDDEFWYLASGIKVPVAITVMRAVERGDFDLDTRLVLSETDYVDGAGDTNWHGPGSRLTVRYLIEQMLISSDNTATDMLIRHVGIRQVNAVTRELVPNHGIGEITTLADVRRYAYSGFHPDAFHLSDMDFFALKKARTDSRRIETLAELLEVNLEEFAQRDINTAYERYYSTRLNSGRLSAYSALLGKLINGEALNPESTEYLVNVMLRAETGRNRIRAGLPGDVAFAHKTGTQHRRACDLGVIYKDAEPKAIVTACTRDFASLSAAETALRSVGEAIRDSGLLETTSLQLTTRPPQ